MEPLVFAVVLSAAVLHASWNALVKSGGDPYLRLAIVNLTHTVAMLPLLPFVGVPDAVAWPWLIASVFTHLAYYRLLAAGYQVGDLSQVYPIARGVAPPMVALGAFLVADELVTPAGAFAILLVCAGIALSAGRGLADRRPVMLALGTGAAIAAYTICDGMGGRASGDVLGYVAWLFFLDGWPFAVLVAVRRGPALVSALPQAWKPAVGGGLMSVLAYGLVIWAMSQAPMAYVSALRETSVVLAALIGTVLMSEPFGRRRVAAAVLVAVGVVLLQLSR